MRQTLPDSRVSRSLVMALAIVVLTAWPAAAAEIDFVDMFRTEFATQTGDGSTLSTNGFRFDTHLFSSGADPFTGVQLFVGLASHNLTGGPIFTLSSSLFATQTAMDTAFPFGLYEYEATNALSQSTNFNYTADLYPAAQPFLTGTDFSDLQGMNPAASFTFHLSAFDEALGATGGQLIFFTIFDPATNTVVFEEDFLRTTTTTQIVVPGGTLLPDQLYGYELIYSNRVISSDDPGDAMFPALLAFERRTGGRFETGAVPVPGPASWTLMTTGACLAVLVYRRRQRGDG